MEFIWVDYCPDYENQVDALFDSDAIKFTGCDEGFKAFYDYWLPELGQGAFWSKIVFYGDVLIGVLALAKTPEGTFSIQEFVVSPEYRGKGYGTRILIELMAYSKQIIGEEILVANAVIYPNNVASQKSFLKAGFLRVGEHPDGDAWYYQYNKKLST